ncbi:hypothetical protein BWZ22_08025 [Seonamhaeicola sp. S2-3]|uniref:tetratricopeptide repeat protein n=1 Tax=Seonamhaeicola sp. S2-3 TaxID=1936081 RepID=UPI000972C717|nr:tetratricopeptide repeat protein [Seonamhaeicola sp. S2-3]APY11194.1 hypothetical protein BWZ22_08025 [Seonamhaeicola sp. S2-3]
MEDKNYILFESYLSGALSKEEMANFELQLQTEPEFNQAFNTYKELSSFLANKFENEAASAAFKENVKKISDKYFNQEETKLEQKPKPKVFPFYKYAIAACVLLFIGLFTFNQFSNPNFSDYNSYETISLTVRGSQNTLLKTAENAFNTKDFAKAEEAFSQLLKQDTANKEFQLYKGIALIELDKFNEADALLEKLSKEDSAFKNDAIWYLGLSKLKQKDYEASLEILKTLPEDANNYNKAQKLIKKLD